MSQFPQLKVIARSSAFEYKNKNIDLKEVSDALGVQAVLTGRVAQRDDDLLVSVELVNARDRTQIWGERYSRKAADIQGIEKEITRAISEKLRLRLSGAQEQQLAKRATQNPVAYELYLTGVFYYRQPGLEGIKKSLDYFDQAITLDPNFAPAWVEVGRVNNYLAGNSVVNPKEPLAKAKAALQQALALDETLPDAHLELARIKHSEWNWREAENEYLRAMELNGNLAEAHSRYSPYLSLMGRHTEALAENKRAQELDPLRIGLRRQEAVALSLARRHDEAVEKAERAMSLEQPNHGNSYFGLALIYESNGMYQQAIESYRKAISILGETTSLQCYLGYTLAMSGKRKEAQSILHKLKTTKEYVSPTELANASGWAGR
ncbi:MAG: tetratricopeptide repeat protein [Pyrinomonadaceae bacterium]